MDGNSSDTSVIDSFYHYNGTTETGRGKRSDSRTHRTIGDTIESGKRRCRKTGGGYQKASGRIGCDTDPSGWVYENYI